MCVGLGGVGPLDGGVGLVAVGVVDVGAGADDELGAVEFVSCFEGLEAGEGSGGQLELGLGGAVDLVLGGEFLQRFVSERWVTYAFTGSGSQFERPGGKVLLLAIHRIYTISIIVWHNHIPVWCLRTSE